MADPDVQLQVGTERMGAIASTCDDTSRDALWKRMAGIYPPYDAYQARMERRIPVVILTPEGERGKARA